MRHNETTILNYNFKGSDFSYNWGYSFFHIEKEYSLTIAQIFRNKIILRSLLVAVMMVCNLVGAWAQAPFTLTTADDVTNGTEKLYWIESRGAQGFFAIPMANSNDAGVTTSNMPNEMMLWYFMDAGIDDGTQYYYIINKSTGKYLRRKGNHTADNSIGIAAKTDANEATCKFSISGSAGQWLIKTGDIYYINKKGSNVNYTNGLKSSSAGAGDYNSEWIFIQKDVITWAHPFTNSNFEGDKHYYFIQNRNKTSFAISTHNDYASVLTERNNNSVWYFVEAAADATIPNLKYYYVVNAPTGKRMYFNSATLNGNQLSNAIDIRTYSSEGEEEDRYLFAVVNEKGNTYEAFSLVPKKLLSLYNDKFTALGASSMSDNSHIGTLKDRGKESNDAHWTFEVAEYPIRCTAPIITYDSTTGKISMTASPAGSNIYYTTDGTTPDENSTNYSAAISVSASTTFKAITKKEGYFDSEVTTTAFSKVATPTIQNNGANAISITCETTGTTIYYTTDGSTPTTSSAQYTGPMTENVSGLTIKAIAVKDGMINSEVGSGSVSLKCAKPIFTRTGNEITISCAFPTSGISIYFTRDGSIPTNESELYSGDAISVTTGQTIKAIAKATGYSDSDVTSKTIFAPLNLDENGKYLLTSQSDFENFIDMASTAEYANGHYILQVDVTAGPEITIPFTGTFDGGGHTIGSLNHALFNSINGGTVKDVMLDDVSISGGTNAGAIANEATSNSRIYNCGVLSGTVGGSGNVGGIIGLLDGSSRVINCFSYANITGGSNVGGIVGYNNVASTATNIQTMIMNCMFYGDITSGSTVSPIYGGQNINNLQGGLNTYNYYAYDNLKSTSISTGKYNCALGVEDRFLKRIEFYRQLLNSNKRLAAKYASKEGATVNATDMMKWVLETADRNNANPKPYPVLKAQAKYPSIVNYDAEHAPVSASERNVGGNLGTLAVTINSAGIGAPAGAKITNSSFDLIRTDKDFARFNYNYDKVQLPYYNEVGEGNYTSNKVVTGWKITSMTGGTAGTYSATDAWGGYNFADRNCTNKDLYGTGGSNRVFSQGAYFDVPYGVTAITIEPYWGQAAYVSDEYFDVVYSTGYNVQNVEQLGKLFGANGVEVLINGSSQKVYTSIANAVGALSSGGTVYDHAVVLVGNVHLAANPPADNKSFTIMSADLDMDNEPDCSFIFGHNNRQAISPIRFDFINMPGIAMAQKPNGAEAFRNVSIFKPRGWFEITNTCLVHLVQLEYDNGDKKAAPFIVQGGLIDQFVSTQNKNPDHNTLYIHLGGNAWFKNFGNGTHSDGNYFTPHIPISVTGGEYEGFYLSGTYKPEATVKADNAECYISSGYFGEVAGAAQQQINGNVQWQIYNADIDNFFGGGINYNKPITGNITIDITNSYVGTFCGGPKFGDMAKNKTVTTNATGCTFGTYFGAGYGGISYNRVRTRDKSGADVNLGSWQNDYTGIKGKYYTDNNGVATDFDYEFFVWSTGVVGARFYVKYSSLSMAKTNNVTSTLTDCTIKRNFYGGGNLGKVDGTATSVLNSCTVEGNVFGGGYSATTPKVPYRTGGFSAFPKIDANAGVFDMGEMSDTLEYTLIQGTLTNNTSAINTTAKTIVTDVDLTSLGQVTTTDLTINGNTIVKGKIFNENGNNTETTGGVFGGGDMSAVNGNTLVKVLDTNKTEGVLNVFGGGNTADVGGNTEVNVIDGKVSQAVYGGGKGQNTTVIGDVTVNIGAKDGSTLTGDGVIGNVYGGSAFGAVNATKGENYATDAADISATDGKSTVVNIYGGNVTGKVFGGGLGQTSPSNIAARSFGDVTVAIEGGKVETAVYGGSNANGVLKKNSTVTITGGIVGTMANPITDAVFGGGFGEPTLVEGNVEVNIGTSGQESAGATINGNIYGGGALGNVNTSKPAGILVFDATKKVDVNLFKGTINGDVYGGGLGQKTGVNGAESDILSYVGGDVTVILNGAKIPGSIFGCNNLNGTPKGHVKVWVKKTVDSTKNSGTDRESRITNETPVDVTAVYGGGNKADYVPTNATIVLPDPEADSYKTDSTNLANARTEVIVEGCQNTSIGYVYGGGNAAAVPATDVTIKGSYIVDYVFGGGNGSGENNPGANVGVYKLNSVNTNYGTGKAVTKLLGGYINKVYGGSNTKGDIAGGTDVRTKQKNEIVTGDKCNDLNVGNIYGAGSKADVNGDVKITLECMPDDYVDAVYGGAELATVNGDVMLTVTSGKFGRVFGGNNEGGDIHGSITVNVYEDGCKLLKIGELYGGGNAAPYSIYGCTEGTPWTANTSGTLYFDEATKERAAIQVNIYSCTSVGKVYGGGRGATAQVIGNTHVWINPMKGIINGTPQSDIGKVGQVFGGGGYANVKGNTRVDIGTSEVIDAFGGGNGALIESGDDYLDPESDNENISITAGVYGGGYSADVDGDATLNIGTKNLSEGVKIAGNIFGGGYGKDTHVTGNVTVNIGTNSLGSPEGYANITGDVYGGSAKGKVNSHLVETVETYSTGKATQVNLYGGTISGDLYGGGQGDLESLGEGHADIAADVYGPITVNVEGGKVTDVFGCNNVLGSPKSIVTVNIDGMDNPTTPGSYTIRNVYGGGNQAAYNGEGGVSVVMTNGWVNDVFGGGLGETADVTGNTTVTVSGGSIINDIYGGSSLAEVIGGTSVTLSGEATVGRDIYGGGSLADVTGAVAVALNGGTVTRDVYGGGALANTNTTAISEGVYPATDVTLNGATVTGIIYGGGLGDKAALGEGHSDVGANVGGPVTVTITNGRVSNVFGCNNINGAPQKAVIVNVNGGTITNSVFGGGNQATYGGSPTVNVTGGTINYNVFGGGNQADVAGSVNVNISGGEIKHDVYGGGALANTNTANWNTSTNTWNDTSTSTYYAEVKHLSEGASVTGFYTRSGEGTELSPYVYEDATGTAAENTKYYKKLENFLNVAANGTTYKTNVSLTGGIIGNAYGGGLGRFAQAAVAAVYTAVTNGTTLTSGNTYYTSDAGAGEFTSNGTEVANGTNYYELTTPASPAVAAVEAMVYGDVSVTVDGTKFTKETERVDGKAIPTTGRVFGCNNKNGTPKGSVMVTIESTKRLDGAAGHVKNQFEILGVYGGGNMANYAPNSNTVTPTPYYDIQTEFGRSTHVLIKGCDKTSIDRVYGGGNASDVPFTDVVIEGSFQIGYVFGGGNGGDKINKGSGWEENPGANVTHYTNVLLHGGTIGESFGGSDSKGNCGGFELTKDAKGICQLRTENIYGANKEADSDGNVTLNLSGCESNIVDKVFGGSYNANVRGSITINITSGIYTSVFGGNDRKGTVGGNITINVEEVDACNPIIIQNLYGGGSLADYPGTGALTYKGGGLPTGPTEHPDSYTNFTNGNIAVNIRAATRIDNIFGGCDNAKVTGNTEVNINMVKGSQANNSFSLPASYTGETIPNIHEGVIDDAIGTIGNVYGGGNQGDVDGNTTVNIGSSKDVIFANTPTHLTPNEETGNYDVLGANITGNVFGGGNEGNVSGNTTVNIQTADYSTPPTGFVGINITNGSVYGGGNSADVLGNTNVTMSGGYVFNGIFGGGYSGSVGTFTSRDYSTADYGHIPNHDGCIGKPTACKSGTGKCTVVVNGGQIGPVEVATEGMPNPHGWVWGGGFGLIEDPATHSDTHFKTYVNETDVTIGGTAFIMEGVIGGGEFGRVLGNTLVKIQGNCQIGVGEDQKETVGGVLKPKRYTEEQWAAAKTAVTSADVDAIATAAATMPECAHFPYGEDTNSDGVADKFDCLPYDPFYDKYYDKDSGKFKDNIPEEFSPASTAHPSDGKTWIGVVFGGGSGYMPYEKDDGTGYDWCQSAGLVEGSTKVIITGGHILTNVYGGNEYTDVTGDSCVVIMTGGTLGVPRTVETMKAHPVTCYLFGSGKGDQRTHFNTCTNVKNTRVHVGGEAFIFGSVFGGGEDGHVLENARVDIYNGNIGTIGTSYVDGNVFGAGRGFSGDALTAGSVGGNVDVTIAGGTILGSVYGGGRMASVGIDFTAPNDPTYGQFKPDGGGKTYGHVTVDISGGTIGNDIESILVPHTTGGNVYGGSMGRLTKLNGLPNPLWPRLAEVKTSTVNISGTSVIKGNVYGGGEFGTIYNDARVNISGGTIWRDVFGGGYGSDINTESYKSVVEAGSTSFSFTPIQFAGCVGGNTSVNISGGWVKKNVYGGGELASVGIIDFATTDTKKHTDVTSSFALSWPCDYTYVDGLGGGTSSVNITGGRIGITGKDFMGPFNALWVPIDKDDSHTLTEDEIKDARIDNGDIFGGSKGKAGDRYDMAYCANVKNASVTINYSSNTATPTNYKTQTGSTYPEYNYTYPCIAGSVYGGGENGHVVNNSSVTLNEGLIGHAIYGGGKGKDTYKKTLDLAGGGTTSTEVDIYSITAGKVYGNTNVTMTGGTVVRNIYGGGNMASVGKGNYAGGSDDYTTGYGEKITTALWSNTDFTGSGKTTVSITGGQVGYIDSDPSKSVKDDLPYGNVFGGCRGQAAAEAEGININPDFYVGYVNETDVTIGTVGEDSSNPRIYGSVYGGGQDGHVRRDTKVTINNGEIGAAYTSAEAANTLLHTADVNDLQWLHRGNVYGAGSGIGKYEFDGNDNGKTWTDANSNSKYDAGEEDSFTTSYGSIKERGYSSSAGSITRNTTVEIKGGTIHRNVYGGGSLASVISNGIAMGTSPYNDATHGKMSVNTVNISGGKIGSSTDYGFKYGGNVFGASRGSEDAGIIPSYFALTTGTQVNIQPNATPANSPKIAGNVYGGGEMGLVKLNTKVQLTGGTIDHDAYGGGKGTDAVAADIGGDVTVELNNNNNGETADGTKRGCVVDRIFGCNDYNGTPKGHVTVHVYATQNGSKDRINLKFNKRPAQGETIVTYLKRLIDAAGADGVSAKVTASVISAANTTWTNNKDKATLSAADSTNINTAIADVQEELCKLYDVKVVYGGGNLAEYNPTNASSADQAIRNAARTEVIIDGCSLTSIRQVYGGGNAAPTPGTYVRVNGTYEIDEVFGGGNGKDDYQLNDGMWYQNPGANVGYGNYTHYDGSHGTGSQVTPYVAIDNTDAGTKEQRQAYYRYGSGTATTEVVGGHVHMVYGGSNQKGNISTMALSVYQESGTCDLIYDKTYGAGKNADIDGEARVSLDCVAKAGQMFGGSTNANVNSDVKLTVTNGTFDQVFGGNDRGGLIRGSITVNVIEQGCQPIIIGELYGGGYLADYSIYGYYNAGTKESPDYRPRTKEKYLSDSTAVIAKVVYPGGATEEQKVQIRKDSLILAGLYGLPYADPIVNVISATYIGTVYGGGYRASVVGSPHVNVNMETGKVIAKYANKDAAAITAFSEGEHASDKEGVTYYVKSHPDEGDATLAIGKIGYVFGGGNKADIIGNTYVNIGTGKGFDLDGAEDNNLTRNAAFITGSVYGGGKMGHVGNFTLTSGKPTSCAEGTGTCYVTISNGEIGPDNMQMTSVGGPDDAGHVFGAGQGTVDLLYDDETKTDEQKQAAIAELTTEEKNAKIAAVDKLAYANNTEVLINGTAFIKGSVFGGSENGHVLGDTHVTIDGDCQIGNGDGVNRRYTPEEWAYDVTADPSKYLAECSHWPYESPYAPHDKFANVEGYDAEGGAVSASDGHTFYGNVFGGGSGYYPAAPGLWVHKAGWVEGNTLLEIKGGHILTSAYGGNEMTNVGDGLTASKGKCTIRMTGGTLGVPRTLAQIDAHPVTCYLFGSGKGDQITKFNTETNVREVDVQITGGWIYGSVFGSGEDGHVLGDVKMTIGGTAKIGTWGTSYVDGNVFGGGRGFSGNALTAGNVGGSIDLDITGGTMLGSIYGGGRLGSVGYGLYAPENENYGVMRNDTKDDAGTTNAAAFPNGRGHIDINISGGTIGNRWEFIDPMLTGAAWTTATAKAPKTTYDTAHKLTHTKGGNVYTGGMGRRTALNGSVISNWKKLGNVKSTKLTISGTDTWIMGNVYGGGEFGAVTGNHDTKNTEDEDIKTGTEIIINGGTIGTEITDKTPVRATIDTPIYNKAGDSPSDVRYTYGSVFGGGYGTEDEIAGITTNTDVDKLGAYVADSTYINMTTGLVRASIYGGGEVAAIGGSTNINISGGKIGRNEVYGLSTEDPGYVKYGGATTGNVFGGGKGTNSHTLVGVVKRNTTINISAGDGVPTGEPFIYHNIYGGGAYASVGTFIFSDGGKATKWMETIPEGIPLNWVDSTGIAVVNIKGGTIGISGRDNGMVNGSSRGDIAKPVPTYQKSMHDSIPKDPYDKMAWVDSAFVNIGETGKVGPRIKGSVYGGGENGHVFTRATVNVKGGTIGFADEEEPWYDFGNDSINEAAWITRGNVYGAGCGTDMYDSDDDGKNDAHNAWAGCVIGNTEINISGGHVTQNVYGGGSMGSVGRIVENETQIHSDVTNGFALSWPSKFVYQELSNGLTTGKATINITGGRIGTTGSDNGDVFGGTRGEAGDRYDLAPFANVKETEVIVDYTVPATKADLAIIENIENGQPKFSLRLKEGVNAIAGSVYGGSENGHVNENTKVDIRNGLIGHSIYGGGKGKGTYKASLWKIGTDPNGAPDSTAYIYDISAGKVYGNTTIAMSGGHVVRNIYGGGNMGSVGKGNYAGGPDDYSTRGYGESLTTNLWQNADFLNSGKTDVSITGGTVGFMIADDTEVIFTNGSTSTADTDFNTYKKVCSKDELPTGNVFGGCRGESARNVDPTLSPRWKYCPEFFAGYVNETHVTIGDNSSGPTLYGSVYGGGQDGHVRRSTNVIVNKGEIGIPFSTKNQEIFGTDLDNLHWLHRGNVYGSGSGIGQYKDSSGNKQYSNTSGSVTDSTTVTINNGITGTTGNIIYRNVYGGGSLSTIGPPKIFNDQEIAGRNWSMCTVNIAGTIGYTDPVTGYNKMYGGEVYGGCRGISSLGHDFGTSIWTLVKIKDGANILGNVFGGGDAGKILRDSEVIVGAE